MEITSESPQKQASNPQMASTISSDLVTSSEHVSTSENVLVPEHVVPEHTVPEQLVPEQTLSSTIPETISEPNNIITSDATGYGD
jgi:hypothetical protein